MIFSSGLRLAVSRGCFVLESMKGERLSGQWPNAKPYLEKFDPPAVIPRPFLIPSALGSFVVPLFSRPPLPHPIVVLGRMFCDPCPSVSLRRAN